MIIYWIVTTFILGVLLVYLFPKYSKKAAQMISSHPGKTLLTGFLFLTTTPFAVILLSITVIGIPLALILTAIYIMSLYISKFFFILWIGLVITNKFAKGGSTIQSFLAGLIVVSIIKMVPGINSIIVLFTLLFGSGAMILSCKRSYSNCRKEGSI